MSSKFFSFLFLAALFAGCTEEQAPRNKDLERQLWGEWESISLKLTMNTFNNKNGQKIFEADEKDWEAKMNIRPIKTIYFGDGSYVSEHRNLRDSIIYSPAGCWEIRGDSLSMRDTFPQIDLEYKYKIVFNNGTLELSGIEDSDRDGNKDDLYFGRQRQLKK